MPGNGLAEPTLTMTGLVLLGLVPVGTVWAWSDHRRVRGTRVAIKPLKFTASIGIYLLTISWMLGFMAPYQMSSPVVRITAGGLVIGFVGALLPLAFAIGLWPRPDVPPLMITAIVTGLIATLILGALSGRTMAQAALAQTALAHTALAQTTFASTPRRDLVLPYVGWRLPGGGGQRLTHFLGIHALQAFPLTAAMALTLCGPAAPWIFTVTASGYVIITLVLLYHVPRDMGVRPELIR